MTKSTASFIDYELRPAKQTERRMLLAYLESLKEAGVQVSASRYIGMGGTKFYDFAMVYRFLGIDDLVSCERDAKMAVRSKYNRPFASIKVRHEPVGEYLNNNLGKKTAVSWLDYDDALTPEIVDDIRIVGNRARVGSSIFVTVAGGLPRNYIELTEQERLEDIYELFGDFAADVTIDDVEESTFTNVAKKIILTAFTNAFSGRDEGSWEPHFRVEYRDSTMMLTIGGSFLKAATHELVRPVLERRLPFLSVAAGGTYRIRSHNITQIERQLFEFASSARSNSQQANRLKKLGFSDTDLRSYRELVRFMPRYVEVFN